MCIYIYVPGEKEPKIVTHAPLFDLESIGITIFRVTSNEFIATFLLCERDLRFPRFFSYLEFFSLRFSSPYDNALGIYADSKKCYPHNINIFA